MRQVSAAAAQYADRATTEPYRAEITGSCRKEETPHENRLLTLLKALIACIVVFLASTTRRLRGKAASIRGSWRNFGSCCAAVSRPPPAAAHLLNTLLSLPFYKTGRSFAKASAGAALFVACLLPVSCDKGNEPNVSPTDTTTVVTDTTTVVTDTTTIVNDTTPKYKIVRFRFSPLMNMTNMPEYYTNMMRPTRQQVRDSLAAGADSIYLVSTGDWNGVAREDGSIWVPRSYDLHLARDDAIEYYGSDLKRVRCMGVINPTNEVAEEVGLGVPQDLKDMGFTWAPEAVRTAVQARLLKNNTNGR